MNPLFYFIGALALICAGLGFGIGWWIGHLWSAGIGGVIGFLIGLVIGTALIFWVLSKTDIG